jgi:predicted Fe-S protein YdhL (DUF1289 family)
MKKKHEQVLDPCIQICTIDPDNELCMGCSRTSDEINNWFLMTPEEQIELIEKLKNR